MKKVKVALIYDFDKTLSTNDMQTFGFIQGLNMTADQFWDKCTEYANKNNSDRILTCMQLMVECCKDINFPLTRDYLVKCGTNITFFDGVSSWFSRINEFGKKIGLDIEHYVVSSGLKEIIEGTEIAKYFKEIYASYFVYKDEIPVWPAVAINYTNKTQFIYRINKGIFNITDDSINEQMSREKRYIPFQNMIYLGDSLTDIPCMRLIMKSGGNSIGLYEKGTKNENYLRELLLSNRINYIAEANFKTNNELDIIVKEILQKIKYISNLENINIYQKNVKSN